MGRGTGRVSVPVLVLLCALAVGTTSCSAPDSEGQQEAESQQITSTLRESTEVLPDLGEFATSEPEAVELTGLVEQPAMLTVAELQELPTETVDVSYETGGGSEQHTYRGVRL